MNAVVRGAGVRAARAAGRVTVVRGAEGNGRAGGGRVTVVRGAGGKGRAGGRAGHGRPGSGAGSGSACRTVSWDTARVSATYSRCKPRASARAMRAGSTTMT